MRFAHAAMDSVSGGIVQRAVQVHSSAENQNFEGDQHRLFALRKPGNMVIEERDPYSS